MRWGNWLLSLSLLLTGCIISQVLNAPPPSPPPPLCVIGCLNAPDACKVGGQLWCIQASPPPSGCLGSGKCHAPRCREFRGSVLVHSQCRPTMGPLFDQYKFKKWYDCNGDGRVDCGCYAAFICPKSRPPQPPQPPQPPRPPQPPIPDRW